VHLPWLNLRVRVSFSGLGVNTDRQVYEGTMQAVQASGSPLDATLANQPGGAGEWLSQDRLRQVHEYASDAARLVSSLRGQPVELPIGFDRVIEGQQITVGIVGMVFSPRGAYLNAAIVFPLPWLGPGQHLGIGAREICFSPNGLGRTVELYLARDLGYRASDASWAINLKAPQEARGGMPPDSGTYVRFGCAGFEFLRVALEVEFPRSWMVPVPDDGSSPVRLRFTTTVRSTGDFIATARMNRFSPAGAPGFEMQCDNVVLDFSDRDNPEGIQFPDGYGGERSSRWQGFYLGTLRVQLPEQLRTFSGGPPQISLRHMIIDRSGVNFRALATSVISYPDGNFGGWGASIDTIELAVVNSSLQSGRMGGRFKLPVSDSAIRYSAILRDSSGRIRFEFTLQPSGTINLPLWVASLDIEPTSWVRLEAGSGTRFVARARLDGTINFGGTREIPLRMGGIRIQGFQIQTHEPPYVQVQSISFASPPHALFAPPEPPDGPSGGGGRSAGGFPITIGGFEMVSGDRRQGPGVGIRFTLSVNLHANTISGGTALSIWGVLQTSSSGPPSFVLDGIDLDSIGLQAYLGVVEIAGSVRIYSNHATYGNGFRGAVTANFVRMVEIGATVQFGTVRNIRYWYVDARAIVGSGIPIFSGVALYGFGGGAWYNMRRDGRPDPVLPRSTDAQTSSAGNERVGATNSGVRYVPAANGWGFFALVTFGTHPKPDILNGDLTLTVSFNGGGGISAIELRGNAVMLAGLLDRRSARITASAEIGYNFENRTFYGDFRVDARLEAVEATGRLVLHFSPDVWYIKIGNPEPWGERVQISVLNNLITLQAYLMVGTRLPSMPPLPPEVTELTGPIPAPVRPAELGRGDGFAFGAEARFAPPELRFLIFYASIRFLVGFDVALLNYGATAQCSDGRRMGANGWYATGQMYARLDASVGLFVDLWFVQGKFEILGLTVGAALQAGLPNPTWIAGAVAGSYSILGGLISGYCNFRFTLGERCTPPLASALAAVEMISDIAPENGATDVSLFAEPTAFFNIEPDRPFALEEMQEDGSAVIKIFRIRVGRFTLAKQVGTSWRSVPVSRRSSRVGDAPTVVITPNDGFLEQRTRYRAEVMAFGQEYSDYARLAEAILRHGAARTDEERQRIAREVATNERYWRDVYNAGRRIEQTVTTEFVTEALPDTLRDVDILVAYPRDRQRFFLTGECRNGFIQLRANRQDLFNRSRSGDTLFLYRVRFVDIARNEQIEVPLTYRATYRPTAMGESPCTGSGCSNRAGIIEFTIPSTLRPEAIYAVQVLRRDSVIRRTSTLGTERISDVGRRQFEGSAGMTSTRIQTTVSARIQTTVFNLYGSTLQVWRSTRPSGFDVARRIASNEKLLTVYFFRTSRYATLEQKLAEVTTAWTDSVNALFVVGLGPVLNSPEGFDEHDVNEYTVSKPGLSNPRIEQSYKFPPLIRFNAWGRSDRWHTFWVNPRVYDEMTWLCDLTRCPSTSDLQSSRWHITRVMRRGEPMFSVISGAKSPLSDHEIGSATGDPMWLGLVRFARLSIGTFQAVPGATGGSGIPGTMPPVSGMGVRTQNAITCSYIQPTFVLLDFSNLRSAATQELRWCGSGGDIGYDPATCDRLRAIARRTFVFPYRGEYTITASYLYCQDPDRPRSHQFRFRY